MFRRSVVEVVTGSLGRPRVGRPALLWLAAGFVASVLVVAAGCGGGGADSVSVVEVNEGEAIQIRTMFSFDGLPWEDHPRYRAIKLALEDFHGLFGYEVELGEPLDSACSGEGGREAARRVLDDSRVLAVIGPSCSVAGVVVSSMLSDAGLSMISPSNTSPALTSDLFGNASSDYYPGYFRVANNDLNKAHAAAEFAYFQLGLRRMASIHDGDPYTSGLALGFRDSFREHGGEVVSVEAIEKGDRDMSEVLARFASVAPDGIFFPLFVEEGLPFVQQISGFEGLSGVALIGAEDMLSSRFLSAPESEDVYIAGPEVDLSEYRNQATGKDANSVSSVYESAYGELPSTTFWPHAYDATVLLLASIQRAAVKDEGNFLTRALGLANEKLVINRSRLREDIRDVSSGFQGLTGDLSCDDFGDCGSGRVNIYHNADFGVTDSSKLPVVYRFP